jgi:ATP synthase protein I
VYWNAWVETSILDRQASRCYHFEVFASSNRASVKQYFSAVRRVLALQSLVIAIGGLAGFALGGWQVAKSLMLGGVTAFAPNLYFAYRAGISAAGRSPKDILRAFYVGEAVKLMATAGLFYLVFQLPDIRFLPLFAGFTAVLSVFWFALLMQGADE